MKKAKVIYYMLLEINELKYRVMVLLTCFKFPPTSAGVARVIVTAFRTDDGLISSYRCWYDWHWRSRQGHPRYLHFAKGVLATFNQIAFLKTTLKCYIPQKS